MMKKLFLWGILIACLGNLQAQSLTSDDFHKLTPYLKAREWKSAFDQSSHMLKTHAKDTSDYHAKIVYINIFSAAAMVSESQMSYERLTKAVMKFVGQKIIMAYHQITYDTTKVLGFTSIESNDTINQSFTAVCNEAGTNIYCFEICRFKDRVNLADYKEGDLVQCGGRLDILETNPCKSDIWILSMTLTQGFVKKDE
ncbi:MAG: hypothetical protein WCL06_07170 [Bacteroidota bacterium]